MGSNIGQYRILRKIGAGGMGTVFVGEHILLGRRAAIKTLLPALSVQREIVDRFFNEARATSAISDPGVVQVFDFGYHVDGTAYIVMELLEGEALSARLDRLGKLSVSESLRIARQVAGALSSAHAHDIVHRDLKPENIFLIHDAEAQNGERAKILDFGICKLGGSDRSLTQSGAVMGTPVYMSPEQCRGAGSVDHRSDIYALGCGLFHMVTGRAPFECEGAGDFIVAHMQTPPPAPSEFATSLPAAVDALILRCLAKSPDDRFQSMGELQVAIEAVLSNLHTPKSLSIPPTPALALGAGFQSSYDGNFGTALPRRDGVPQRTPHTPTTLGSASGQTETEIPRRTGRRAALAALVLVGMFGGLFATSAAIDADSASDEPLADRTEVAQPQAPRPTVAAVAPPSARAPVVATPAKREASAKPVRIQLEPDRGAPPTRTIRKPAAKPKQAKKPAVRRTQPPATASTTPTPQKPTATSTEDLYDTR